MAERTPVLLEGGPCDGQKTTARRADFGPVSVTCKGVRYEPTDQVTQDGRLVYRTAASLHAGAGAAGGSGTRKSSGPSSWHHMLQRVFVDAPRELQKSAKARENLRRLRHRRGLR